MKRSIDETDDPNANDARQKLKDSLIPSTRAARRPRRLLQCCYSIWKGSRRDLWTWRLVHEFESTARRSKKASAHGGCTSAGRGLRHGRGYAGGRY